jgi:4-carboxymuconolactone decarboxylase
MSESTPILIVDAATDRRSAGRDRAAEEARSVRRRIDMASPEIGYWRRLWRAALVVSTLPAGSPVLRFRAGKPIRRQAMVDVPNRPEYQSELFKKGLEVRRDVLGKDYVDASLARADDFNAAFQQMTTEIAWGMCWTRPGIDRKTRSMINLTMLSALNRGAELRLHLKAALTNGVTRDEIKEILMQVGAYCGIPACLEAFKIATEVFKEVDEAKG